MSHTTKTIEKISESHVRIAIEVPYETVNLTFAKAVADLTNDVQIPGFRKGKTPHAVIERKFADDIKKHVLQTLISQEYDALFNSTENADERPPIPISEPNVKEIPEIKKDAPLQFSFEYDVMPDFVLPDLESMSATSADIDVSDEDIADELRHLQEQNADVRKKQTNSIAKNDVITLDYVEHDDAGNEIEETRRKGFTCTAGDDALGLGDAVIGLEKDVTKTIDIEKEGTKKTAVITVSSISEKTLPELDDEFAQDINEEYATLDDLKRSLREKQKEQLVELQNRYFVSNILEQFMEQVTIALPESLINNEFSRQAEQYIRKHFPEDPQNALRDNKITQEELHTKLDADIEKSVKNQLILSKLIEQYTLQVTDGEIENEIKTLNGTTETTAEMIAQYKQYGLYERLRSMILERKLNAVILEKSTISDSKSFDSRKTFLNETSKAPTHTVEGL